MKRKRNRQMGRGVERKRDETKGSLETGIKLPVASYLIGD